MVLPNAIRILLEMIEWIQSHVLNITRKSIVTKQHHRVRFTFAKVVTFPGGEALDIFLSPSTSKYRYPLT